MRSRTRPLLLMILACPGCVCFDQGPRIYPPARVSACQPCGEAPRPLPAPIRLAEPQQIEPIPVTPAPTPGRIMPAPPPPSPPSLTPMADPPPVLTPSATVPKRRTWQAAKPVRSA